MFFRDLGHGRRTRSLRQTARLSLRILIDERLFEWELTRV